MSEKNKFDSQNFESFKNGFVAFLFLLVLGALYIVVNFFMWFTDNVPVEALLYFGFLSWFFLMIALVGFLTFYASIFILGFRKYWNRWTEELNAEENEQKRLSDKFEEELTQAIEPELSSNASEKSTNG